MDNIKLEVGKKYLVNNNLRSPSLYEIVVIFESETSYKISYAESGLIKWVDKEDFLKWNTIKEDLGYSHKLPIDNVDIETLNVVLRLVGINLGNDELDIIIDIIELIEYKPEVTLKDIIKIKSDHDV